MVSLGFFNVAGQNDLPFVAPPSARTATGVQTELLAFSNSIVPSAGIKPASVHNLALCGSCKDLFEFPCDSFPGQPQVAAACRQLSTASQVGLSTESLVQGWLAAPYGARTTPLGQCASACANTTPYWNEFAGGYQRPYGPAEP